MKRNHRKRPAGFTLVEMTLAVAMSLGIAFAVIGLLQQHLSFTQVISRFQFIRDEAPQINTLLTTLVNKADSYRIYGNRANATAPSGAVQGGGRSLRLRFRNPDGTVSHAIVSFESQNGGNRLNFYFRNTGQATWPTTPSWTISSRPQRVDFSND